MNTFLILTSLFFGISEALRHSCLYPSHLSYDLKPFASGLWYMYEKHPNRSNRKVYQAQSNGSSIILKRIGVPEDSSNFRKVLVAPGVDRSDDPTLHITYGNLGKSVSMKPTIVVYEPNKLALFVSCLIDEEETEVTREFSWILALSKNTFNPLHLPFLNNLIKASDLPIDESKEEEQSLKS